MRRLSAPPPTGLATAARSSAVFALDAVLISVILLRFHLTSLTPGLMALAGGLAVAVLALILAVSAFVAIWRKGVRGFGRALTGFFLALFLLAPAGLVLGLAFSVPAIVDISTDTADPPSMALAARHRPAAANPVDYSAAAADRQHRDLPQIQSMLVDIPVEDIRKLVLRLIQTRRWQITADVRLAETAERVRLPDIAPVDLIAAVATSTLLGTTDDIVIRIRTEDNKTRIDMRSAARFGSYDFGINANHVQQFMADLRDLALLPDQAIQ